MASQSDSNDDNIIDNGTDLNFDPFTYTCTDDKQYFLSDKVDPDNNFFLVNYQWTVYTSQRNSSSKNLHPQELVSSH